MNILVITTVSGTINAFLIPHIKKMKKMGYNIDIATSITRPLKDDIHCLCDNIYDISFSRNPFTLTNLIAYKNLKAIIDQKHYKIIHTHTPIASFIGRLAARKTRKINNTKIYYTAHGFHFYKGSPIKNWVLFYPLEKVASYYTDVLITINDEDFKLSQKKLRAKQNIKMPGVGVDLSKFFPPTPMQKQELRNKYRFSKNDKILIIVGELNNNKNQIKVLHAVKEVKETIPEIKLLIVGSGKNYDKYDNYILENNLENEVYLLGHRDDVDKLLMISDILISSSKREGLPVNVIEAMACGLSIIVSNIRGNTDLIRHNYNGYVNFTNESLEYSNLISHFFSSDSIEIFKTRNIANSKKYSIRSIQDLLEELY